MVMRIMLAFATSLVLTSNTAAKDLNSIGITVGSLGNPFFSTLAKGAEAKAKEINPRVKVTTVSADYDLNKQFTQVDNFIASGVDLILINAADPKAAAPAIRRAQRAGVAVVAVDVAAVGANATVQTDNVQAGRLACQYIADRLGGKGAVIIENGPQVTAVIDRVNGCKSVLGRYAGIKTLSSDQSGKGSRDGGFSVTLGYLTRFPQVDAIFAINDPQAVGTDLAARQLRRKGIIIASVDGAPDVEAALKSDSQIQASASQDPWAMAQLAVDIGFAILNGRKPASDMVLIPSTLITRENVKNYRGWSSPR
jgi:ribose transport system substrate-binding protein